MKNSKKLKLVLMILICILIILVGFLGVYKKVGNAYKNILPDYKFASDLSGATVLEFEVDTGTETIYYDKYGNQVDSADVTEENESDYTKEEILINSSENLNTQNYRKVVEIMEKRLKFLQANQYSIDLDNKTGKIVLTFEDDYPDDIKSILPMEGKFELVDSNTGDTILNYSDFTSAESSYAGLENGSYVTYINLKLNDSGIEKINNIEQYKTSVDNDEESETSDSTKNETTTEEVTVNNFKIMFDREEIAEVSYDDILVTGKTLRITTAQNLTSDSSINSQLNTNTIISKLATMGKLPVIYNLTAEEYVNSIDTENIDNVVSCLIGGLIGGIVVLILKNKSKGIIAAIAFVANISLFLIIIRLTGISISLNGFAGMFSLIILNILLVCNILGSIKEKDKTFTENIKNAYLKSIDAFVIVLIIFAVFAFSSMTVINSMGLLMFWGWIVILLGNLILTVPMLSSVNK